MIRIYRIQDADGRGPFKPGFSKQWLNPSPTERDLLQPWMEEFGIGIIRLALPGDHLGCGCRSIDGIRRWFLPDELERLTGFGYHCVMMNVDRILAESVNQTVFARGRPLKHGVTVIAALLAKKEKKP